MNPSQLEKSVAALRSDVNELLNRGGEKELMEMRAYIATAAMAALVSKKEMPNCADKREIAKDAIELADALILELKR